MVDFPAGANGRRVQRASVSFDRDVRKAAFGWDDFLDAGGNRVKLDTLSFAAALARTPDLLSVNGRLGRFHAAGLEPFVVFFPSNGFDAYTFSAIRLLCGPQANKGTDWRACSSTDHQELERLRSRVVLIGEVEPGVDQHQTVVGTMPGVWLHANYVEAILNDDLLRPVPRGFVYAYGFLVFFLVELVLITRKSMLFKAVAAVGVVVVAYVVCYLLVELSGLYLNPGLGLIALIFGQATGGIRHWLIPKRDVGLMALGNPLADRAQPVKEDV